MSYRYLIIVEKFQINNITFGVIKSLMPRAPKWPNGDKKNTRPIISE